MNITTIPLHKRYEKILDLYPPQKKATSFYLNGIKKINLLIIMKVITTFIKAKK